MNKKLGLIAIAAAFTLPAWSADDHKGHDHDEKAGEHAHDAKPAHGGVVSVVKDVNYELVAKADSLALHVADHGKPVDLKGASAKLTLLSGTAKSEATLAPNGDRLEAKGKFPAGPGTKVVAVVTRPGSGPASVRFTLK
ncbi:hypothetical protein MW290_03745 [Aquincola tertiaricarbonis]|uniref:Uncharacterized protein n=2 Tax=Aquincola tertiaricarbonis TaxID=391953 RepID=A0ABY4S5L8_AQUTE|nr:hypothetical protein MW290_03745 [Aquincola tertiaricarbonis]